MSVCIVHRDGWAVADSRESMGTMILPSAPAKVIKSDGYLISCVGATSILQVVQKLVNTQGHEIDLLEAIAEKVDDKDLDVSLLCVSYDRRLIHMDGNGCMSDLNTDFWAIGCAEWYVLGRLHLIAEQRPVTMEDAEAAIVAAAVHDKGIDSRVQRFVLDKTV